MKVILKKTVKSLGNAGEIVEVSDGYARNYLLPKDLAKPATEGNVKNLSKQKKAEERKKQGEVKKAKELAKAIEESNVVIETKAGEGGRLFGSVTSKEICEALKKEHGVKVDKRKINLKEPIKTLGVTKIEVKVYPQISATLSVEVKEQ